MPIPEPQGDEGQLFTRVDDEQFDELSELNGQPLVHVGVWEEGLADSITPAAHADATAADANMANEGVAADIDLYLRDGVYFELYGTLCYTDLDEAPLADLTAIEARLHALVQEGGLLEEIAVDEDDGLVLILAARNQPELYLQVGAWLLDEWEELPDSSEP
jgi:hypothetical protein